MVARLYLQWRAYWARWAFYWRYCRKRQIYGEKSANGSGLVGMRIEKYFRSIDTVVVYRTINGSATSDFWFLKREEFLKEIGDTP